MELFPPPSQSGGRWRGVFLYLNDKPSRNSEALRRVSSQALGMAVSHPPVCLLLSKALIFPNSNFSTALEKSSSQVSCTLPYLDLFPCSMVCSCVNSEKAVLYPKRASLRWVVHSTKVLNASSLHSDVLLMLIPPCLTGKPTSEASHSGMAS